MIPRIVYNLFHDIEQGDANLEFTVKISYCELYLERVKDLLDISKDNLKIKENRQIGFYIEDLTEEYAITAEEVFYLMKQGNANKEVAATNMN